jgi:hypothetical protein
MPFLTQYCVNLYTIRRDRRTVSLSDILWTLDLQSVTQEAVSEKAEIEVRQKSA